MARAGRPRKQGPRTKSGRLKQQHDAGTDELRAKKVALVGPGGDPSKSTNTIDILESWGHLTKDQSRSLHYFRESQEPDDREGSTSIHFNRRY